VEWPEDCMESRAVHWLRQHITSFSGLRMI
jgi:hypothetical protein